MLSWIQRAIKLGVGEILLSSIDQDGTRRGYDLELLEKVANFATVPVIAHGGGGTLGSFVEALVRGKVDALSASSIFHYNEYTISEVKYFLKEKGFSVRIL